MKPLVRHLTWRAVHKAVAFLFLWGIVLPCHAQPAPGGKAPGELSPEGGGPAQIEKQWIGHSREGNGQNSLASEWIDVKYYKLDLRISLSPTTLTGKVTIRGVCKQDRPTSLTLDLMNAMHIDSVSIAGSVAILTQQPTAFTLLLDSAYHVGQVVSLDVYYHGSPVATGLGSFTTSAHSTIPWVWTLSEPYGARDWWPCKDHPSDKADSVDILVTTDSSFTVGSNGRLASVTTNFDGTRTTFWKERYPIATYLVSIDLTNFAHFSNWFHYTATDSLEVLNYVLPENLAAAQNQLPLAVDGLDIFSRLFGLYPFINEKYGHSQFLGGGMEHQTMTSITTFAEETIIHELAHQWFGDMITCGSWSHLWLNEGFATYCTALYEEQKYGTAAYRQFMSLQMNRALSASGSVFGRDTTDISELFKNARVYAKGSTVLHVLRHVLGDSLFYRSMHAYANDSTVRFRTAVTEDFRRACEAASGQSLGYFFDEWIYGENYPSYSYSWNNFDSAQTRFVRVTVSQSTGTTTPVFFTMPVDMKLVGGSWDTTVTIFNDRQTQAYVIAVPGQIDSVLLDPDNWILKHAADVSRSPFPTEYSLAQNYPNPFNASTGIAYALPHRAIVNLAVYDVLGRKVTTLFSGTQNIGTYLAHWDATGVASGVYFTRLEAVNAADPGSTRVLVGKMLVVR